MDITGLISEMIILLEKANYWVRYYNPGIDLLDLTYTWMMPPDSHPKRFMELSGIDPDSSIYCFIISLPGTIPEKRSIGNFTSIG